MFCIKDQGNRQSKGKPLDDVDRVSLTTPFNQHQVEPSESQDKKDVMHWLQASALTINSQRDLICKIRYGYFQGVRIGLINILFVAVCKEREGVEEGSLAVRICKAIVSFYCAK